MNTVALLLLLLQLSPPTDSISRRNGQQATISWNFQLKPGYSLLYFSVKETEDLNVRPRELKQVPASERRTQFVVSFPPGKSKNMYYVVSAVYDGGVGESFPSNTVRITRIGPPAR